MLVSKIALVMPPGPGPTSMAILPSMLPLKKFGTKISWISLIIKVKVKVLFYSLLSAVAAQPTSQIPSLV